MKTIMTTNHTTERTTNHTRKHTTRIISLLLTLILIVMCVACSSKKPANEVDSVALNVAGLKGPTSIGIASLINEAKEGKTVCQYNDFTMATAADEINAKFVAGELDIILVPANVASVLYNKTKGNVVVLDINTLGVLYMVSANEELVAEINSGKENIDMTSLKGKTLYMTGKGTTPDYVLAYLLASANMSADDLTIEYKSEPTEVAAALAADKDAVGLLPQPFVTVARANNQDLQVVLDTTKAWEIAQGTDGGKLVTGVTIARKDFIEAHPLVAEQFIKDHTESVNMIGTDLDKLAEYVVELGIIAKAEVAKKAIPNCNIVCIYGEDMKKSLSSYLEVLYNLEPKSVGGTLPGDDFYYINK